MRQRAIIVAAILLAGAAARSSDVAPPGAVSPVTPGIIAWAYPGHRAVPPSGGWDAVTPMRVPESTLTYTAAQLRDLQHAVDWFPASHPPMPPVVADGHAPVVMACGYCHGPNGNGAPENAALAGSPVAYIEAQVAAFADGSRRAAAPDWMPSHTMAVTARAASPAEVHAAAVYFNRLRLASLVRVVETPTVAQVDASGFLLAVVPDGKRELIGQRIVEIAADPEMFERRDRRGGTIAYVPPGSLARGAAITARVGCSACHAAMMQQWGPGRSPSYIFRQLLAFKTGARHDIDAAPMTAVAAQLTPSDMIAVAAYWGSLKP